MACLRCGSGGGSLAHYSKIFLVSLKSKCGFNSEVWAAEFLHIQFRIRFTQSKEKLVNPL